MSCAGRAPTEPSGGPVIRQAAVSDAAAVAGVLAEAFADQRAHFTAEAFVMSTPNASTIGARIAADPVWVAEDGRRVVGTVSATRRSPSMWIRSLAVAEHARGTGLAQRLIAEVERFAIQRGFTDLQLDSTPFQEAAAHLYARLGFVAAERHEIHGTPLIRMIKLISPSVLGDV